jgi:plastocyanin
MNVLKNTGMILISTLFVLASLHPLWAAEEDFKGSKSVVINMHSTGGISPQEVTVELGTTVIWRNDSKAILEILFVGKPVTLSCKSPVQFVVNEDGSYISNRITQGAVASLCFIQKGEFNYVARKVMPSAGSVSIDFRANIKEFKGKVTVK